jgi:hypothetical protein
MGAEAIQMKVSITVVTNNREPCMSAMNPNLVRAAGFKLCLDQGHRPIRIHITMSETSHNCGSALTIRSNVHHALPTGRQGFDQWPVKALAS